MSAKAYSCPSPSELTNNGVVYNLRPTGDEPARVGIVVAAAGGLSKIFLQAPVYIRPGGDGYGLESTFADQPRDAAGIPIQITKIALTFNAKGQQGWVHAHADVVRGGHLAEPGELLGGAEHGFSEGVQDDAHGLQLARLLAEGRGLDGRAGNHDAREFPPVTTTLKFDPEEAALRRAEVTLPISLGPNLAVAQRACSREAGRRERLPRELARGHRDHRLAASGRPRAWTRVHRVQHTGRTAGL